MDIGYQAWVDCGQRAMQKHTPVRIRIEWLHY